MKDMLFLSFALLSWGWLCHTEWVAVGLLVIIAATKSSSWHWFINSRYANRWGDASTVLVVLLLLYVFIYHPTPEPIFVLLKCLPILYAPVLFAQIFSREQKLPLSVLFYSLRRRSMTAPSTIDIQLPYAALTVLSAGAANVKGVEYFVIAVALFTAAIGSVKPKQSPVLLWLAVIVLAVLASHFGHQGLKLLQAEIEKRSIAWLSDWRTDPFKSHTSIGDIGELKLSDKIVFRVKAGSPLLLHQVSYDRYLGDNWIASKRVFNPTNPVLPVNTRTPFKKLEIWQEFEKPEILALPDGTVQMTGLGHATLQYTETGTVEATSAPEFAKYTVFYTGVRTGAPTRFDLEVPKQHAAWLKTYSKTMKLTGQKPKEIAGRISTYFQANFFYSLYLGTEQNPDKAISDFMLKRKAGHCEYFATASVFLLRYMGIPARLANGYAMEEYNADDDLYIVRRRHAHAWAIAYIDGQWQAVDSTPGRWLEMEDDNASFLQPVIDLWSNTVFRFKQWRIQQTESQKIKAKLYLDLVLISILAGRLVLARRRQTKIAPVANNKTVNIEAMGLDSEFYRIEQYFKNSPKARQPHESVQEWMTRIQLPGLWPLFKLHYQLRFDPNGLSAEQRQQLGTKVSAWLGEHLLFKKRKNM